MSSDFKKGLYIGLGVLVALILVGMFTKLIKLWRTSSEQLNHTGISLRTEKPKSSSGLFCS